MTLSVAGTSAGVLVLFPSGNLQLCKKLEISDDLRSDDGFFMGVVLPWKLSSDHYDPLRWFSVNRKLQGPADFPHVRRGGQRVRLQELELSALDAGFVRAVHLLRFPHWLLQRMADHEKVQQAYCVWDTTGDHSNDARTPDCPDIETRALRTILYRSGAQDVGHRRDVRTVFIHVGAMRTVSRLQALSERRTKRPEIAWILYGSHPTVHPTLWGVREIWPLGQCLALMLSLVADHWSRRRTYVHAYHDR
jgi:hypothetical protein